MQPEPNPGNMLTELPRLPWLEAPGLSGFGSVHSFNSQEPRHGICNLSRAQYGHGDVQAD